MMKQITFSCRIVCDDNDGINGLHLCEEIQAYLNSNLFGHSSNHCSRDLVIVVIILPPIV